MSVQDKVILSNGYGIPCVGYGTYRTPDGKVAEEAVKTALEIGYRHIDAAAVYQNEISVGKGIKESGVSRNDIFLTSKVWNTNRGYDKTMAAFEQTIKDLGVDYLDLYLVHWPANELNYGDQWKSVNASTWKAMEEVYRSGKVKAIGVSNFLPHHLEALKETAQVMPMVNQIEIHPGQMQEEVQEYCRENNIAIEAWAPLGAGAVLKNETLTALAGKYNKSVAQICLRWCVQHNVIPLPKSVTRERIQQNTEIFDFVISDEDMALIDAIPYCGGSGLNPDTFVDD